MTHYVCTGGCNGVSEEANATCQAVDCAKHSDPLIACECEEGVHSIGSEEALDSNES